MNYIRGAVNAISAPYQYYRDLPPINPSTLTGAIDVIVIRRTNADGQVELVCSPFHVRFGKWQVLRPGDKKVHVSVNGKSIPFKMKIGEAGEAFFIFETEDDIPSDLITSPLLSPAHSPEPPQPADLQEMDAAAGTSAQNRNEPEFLDLDAVPVLPLDDSELPHSDQTRLADEGYFGGGESSPPSATPTSFMGHMRQSNPSLEQHQEIPLDVTGYHSQTKSGKTITHSRRPSLQDSPVIKPKSEKRHSLFVEHPTPPDSDEEGEGTDSTPRTPGERKDNLFDQPPAQHPSIARLTLGNPIRAMSEPPSLEDAVSLSSTSLMTPSREYSWDWGAFPQPSPHVTRFPQPLFFDSRSMEMESVEEQISSLELNRSQSVPPDVQESPSVQYKSIDATTDEHRKEEKYGAGGRLTTSRKNPFTFGVYIERRTVPFELSIVDVDVDKSEELFDGHNEVGGENAFEKGRIKFQQFMEDDKYVRDPRLIIKWAGSQYITRKDQSPLMDALVIWRNSALAVNSSNRPPSRAPSPSVLSDTEEPLSSDEQDEVLKFPLALPLANSDQTVGNAPTSTGWVRWWNRKKIDDIQNRPELRGNNSAPTNVADTSFTAKTKEPGGITFPTSEDLHPSKKDETIKLAQDHSESSQPSPQLDGKKFAKTLRLSSDQLKDLNLKPGPNPITFSLVASGVIACTAQIFLWESTDVVVISDIDGTITKSDGLGHLYTMIGRDWTHLGVAKLYTDITRNGYKIMYLTSRAIGQADATRDYLKGIRQDDYHLPQGPVIMSPDRLMAALHREVVMRKPEVFKMACLRDIQRLFGESIRNPFYAGFGNRITDALSYRSVNVPSSRIFTIDSTGEVKLELLELAGYKSSYIHMTDLVDQMFPPIHRKWAPDYTDFNFWKAPVQEFPLPELAPHSPALSARSDTSSTLARIRNFSLAGGSNPTSPNLRRAELPIAHERVDDYQNESRLRQMTSFERLSNTLASISLSSNMNDANSGPRSSLSPARLDSTSGADSNYQANGYQRTRTRSNTSMPGSLDDEEFADHYEFEQQYVRKGDTNGLKSTGEYEDADDEDADDEDFYAAGEMRNVPFL